MIKIKYNDSMLKCGGIHEAPLEVIDELMNKYGPEICWKIADELKEACQRDYELAMKQAEERIMEINKFIEDDKKIVIKVAQETSEREKCTKHVNWNADKEMYFLSDIYVQDLTVASFTNGKENEISFK